MLCVQANPEGGGDIEDGREAGAARNSDPVEGCHRIPGDLWIHGDEDHPALLRLSDEDPIEGILVDAGKVREPEDVPLCHREALEPVTASLPWQVEGGLLDATLRGKGVRSQYCDIAAG